MPCQPQPAPTCQARTPSCHNRTTPVPMPLKLHNLSRHPTCTSLPMLRVAESFLQDLKYALRTLRRTPGFTAVAVGCLALGIGANTAIFTLINAVMLRQLPVHDPSALVIVGNSARVSSLSTGTERTDIYSYPMFREIRERNRVFSGIFASGRSSQLTEGSGDGSEHPRGRFVSGEYFDVLGVKPMLGRLFTEADDRTAGG